MKVSGFFNNSWFVGIAGGIISGLIVYFITTYFSDRKKNIEHRKNIISANNAVLEIIRPYIANAGLPETNKLEAIINSIARKHKIKKSEMCSECEFYEDLIVEFMSNLYIPNDIKNRNIEMLLQNIHNIKNADCQPIKNSNNDQLNEKNKNKIDKNSAIFSMIICVISSLFGFVANIKSGKSIGVILVVVITVVLVVSLYLIINERIKNKRNNTYVKKPTIQLYDQEYFKMMNHGTPIDEEFDSSFEFIDFFEKE